MLKLDSKGPIVLDFTRQTDGYYVFEGLQFGRKVTLYIKQKNPSYKPAPAIEVIASITAYDIRQDGTEGPRDEGAAVNVPSIPASTSVRRIQEYERRLEEFREQQLSLLNQIVRNTTPKERKRASKQVKG